VQTIQAAYLSKGFRKKGENFRAVVFQLASSPSHARKMGRGFALFPLKKRKFEQAAKGKGTGVVAP
jgi:hypothetical protein